MFSTIWHGLIFDPIYNLLIALINLIPGGDVGVAIIFLVVIVKVLLLPLSIKATRTQMKMTAVQGELKELQEKYKDDKQTLGAKTLELYRKYNVNPFSSVLVMLIQIPVIFALFFAIRELPVINESLLYAFNYNPSDLIQMKLFGVIDITKGGSQMAAVILGLLAASTQYIQTSFILKQNQAAQEKAEKENVGKKDTVSFSTEFAKGMQVQMKYVMPVMTFVISFQLGAAIAIYWTISNIFAIAQEYYMRKKVRGTYSPQTG